MQFCQSEVEYVLLFFPLRRNILDFSIILAFYRSLIVAPLIVALNYWTIPRYGMTGCAVIFVFSYVLVDFLIYFVFKDTRSLAMIGVRALLEIFTNPRRAWTGSVALLRQRH